MNVLNPALYTRLVARFRDVRVINRGEPFVAVANVNPLTGSATLDIHSAGEQYAVCCPFCGDTRNRLYINHRWGTSYKGHRLDYMAKCHNENCGRTGERCEIGDMLHAYLNTNSAPMLATLAVPDADDVDPANWDDSVEWPGESVLVNRLPPGHPVAGYLTGRGFDLDDLAENWGLSWLWRVSAEFRKEHPILRQGHRLLIPVYAYRKGALTLVAWQSRWFDARQGGLGATPETYTGRNGKLRKAAKYVTHGKKSRVLYNGYRARGGPVVVLCEGVFDAIKFGPERGVCIFGKSLSPAQAKQLYDGWGRHGSTVVIAIDADVKQEQQQSLYSGLTRSGWRPEQIRKIAFPDGYDAGDYSRDVLDACLSETLR